MERTFPQEGNIVHDDLAPYSMSCGMNKQALNGVTGVCVKAWVPNTSCLFRSFLLNQPFVGYPEKNVPKGMWGMNKHPVFLSCPLVDGSNCGSGKGVAKQRSVLELNRTMLPEICLLIEGTMRTIKRPDETNRSVTSGNASCNIVAPMHWMMPGLLSQCCYMMHRKHAYGRYVCKLNTIYIYIYIIYIIYIYIYICTYSSNLK